MDIFVFDWMLMICCKQFKERHTTDHNRLEYGEATAWFYMLNKIITIVSDIVSHLVRAFSLPARELFSAII